MDKKILHAAVVGGLVVFIWGLISWVVLPFHNHAFKQFTNEAQVYQAIKDNAPVSGIYSIPSMGKVSPANQQMMAKGPRMFASIGVEGSRGMSMKPIVTQLIIGIVGAGIITWLLLQTNLKTYKKQVIFITVAGFLVGLVGVLPEWVWRGFSACYSITCFADMIIGWFLAGLAIGKVIKR